MFGCSIASAPVCSIRTAFHVQHKDATSTITGMALGLIFSEMAGQGKYIGSSDLTFPPADYVQRHTDFSLSARCAEVVRSPADRNHPCGQSLGNGDLETSGVTQGMASKKTITGEI